MRRSVLPAILLLLFSLATALNANETEYISKVVSQLDSYVEWSPDKSFEGGDSKLVISAVGETDLIAALKKLSHTESSTGRSIKVRVVDRNMIPSNSHILFLDIADPAAVADITEKLRGTGTLVISHGAGMASSGSSLNFATEAGSSKPIMELSVETAKAEGLSIKPAFLKLAKVVK